MENNLKMCILAPNRSVSPFRRLNLYFFTPSLISYLNNPKERFSIFKRPFIYLVIVSTLIISGCFISGKVVDKNKVGIAGVTVTLSGDDSRVTITDSKGKYRFGNIIKEETWIPVGNYTVTPSKPGYRFVETSRSVEIVSGKLDNDDVPWPVSGVDFESEGQNLMTVGYNEDGQLGDGTTASRSTPVQVATGVAQVAAGAYHSLFVKTDGTLWAMGDNFYGQFGDGTTSYFNCTPIQVATNVSQVAAGGYHSLFVKTDGTLWAMGGNDWGQLGDTTITDRSTPVQVATNVSQVAAGFIHSLFIKSDRTLWATGSNGRGQLGFDLTYTYGIRWPIYRNVTPVQVATGVAQVAAGAYHSLFVKTDRTLWAMGDNWDGQLGDGTTSYGTDTPIQVATDVSQVAAGGYHSLFVKTDGTLLAMGENLDGQLGDGTTTDRPTPVQVATDVAQVAAGFKHSMFLQKAP